MLESLDWKIIAAVVSSALSIGGFVPYLYEVFKGRTKPHVYTWLIWTLTISIAAASIWTGGGGLILSVTMTINVLLCFVTFLASFKYGTKNITRGDTIALVVALFAIFVWFGLESPVLALLIATSIDLIGYWPTFRKSYVEPWSEGIPSWIIYTLAPLASLFAVLEYNVLTVTYSSATLVANLLLIILLLVRRRNIPKPL